MPYRKITAVIRESQLAALREALEDIAMIGFCVTPVMDYGEFATDGLSDGVVEHVRLEIFARTQQLPQTVAAIKEIAHTGLKGDGLIAISAMESIYRIETLTNA